MAHDVMIPPPIDRDIDLRDFVFMPLDVVRLRDSDLAATATAEEFRAAVLLWCASWHQVPAGSLPNDDAVLAPLAGFGRAVKEWRKIRKGALRGWQECSDNRLYHKVICEKATEAWEAKQARSQMVDNKTQRQKRWRERVHHLSGQLREFGVTPPVNASLDALEAMLKEARVDAENNNTGVSVDAYIPPIETPTETTCRPLRRQLRQGQGQGEEKEEKEEAALSASARPQPDFKRLEFELRKAAGCENAISPGLSDLSHIVGLMDQGADFDGEILPAITAKPKADVRSWKWFVPQIQDFRAKRMQARNTVLPPSHAAKVNKNGQPKGKTNRDVIDELNQQFGRFDDIGGAVESVWDADGVEIRPAPH